MKMPQVYKMSKMPKLPEVLKSMYLVGYYPVVGTLL